LHIADSPGKSSDPGTVFMSRIPIDLGDGYAGYLPDAPAYDRPGYEVYASPFRPEAAAAAVSAMGDLLAELANDGGNAE
jgi:hypothetical protein